jgi:hypothetical protein
LKLNSIQKIKMKKAKRIEKRRIKKLKNIIYDGGIIDCYPYILTNNILINDLTNISLV